ncbi:hypothetical protein IWZ01DRAFT_537589 [Phyllosticta capitalensis]
MAKGARLVHGIRHANFARPTKFTFDFTRTPGWRYEGGLRPPPHTGQLWPPKRLKEAREWAPIAQLPAIVAAVEGEGGSGGEGEGEGWLSRARSRIAKCITFGLPPDKMADLADVVEVLGTEWRTLSFAPYGFSVAIDRPVSMNVRSSHPIMQTNPPVRRFEPSFYYQLLDMTRLLWLRAIPDADGGDRRQQQQWKSMGFPNSLYKVEANELRVDLFDQRGPTGNLTVFHRLRPGFVRADGTMHNSFDIDSQVLSAAQERVVAKATGNFSMVVKRQGGEELEGFDRYFAHQLLKKMEDQESARKQAQKGQRWLEQKLKELESSSWNAEGAVEDLGTAAKA